MSGLVVWLTGLPSSGKSTLAVRVAERLEHPHVVLDGDEVRAALRPTPGYDDVARDHFYESLARLAALLAKQGLVVLVPATANKRAFRERARAFAPAFLEVFVDTPLEVCRTRDAKGLYAHAATSDAPVPGAGAAYETPEKPALTVTPDTPDAAARVLEAIRRATQALRLRT